MNHTINNGLTTPHSQPAETFTQDTSNLNFATGARNSKAELNQIARFALAGHAVHPLREGGYLVSKWGYVFYAKNIDALHAFAARMGVRHE